MLKRVKRNNHPNRQELKPPIIGNSRHKKNVNHIIQPRMKVGAANDHLEQEADRVAQSVVNEQKNASPRQAASESIQRQMCIAPTAEDFEEPEITTSEPQDDLEVSGVGKISGIGTIQRKCEECENEDIQKSSKAANGDHLASSNTTQKINQSKGKGQSLPSQVKTELGPKMGSDFNSVRIHTDSNAAKMNEDLNSYAFTHGHDIYFNSGNYQPDTTEGKLLLAHELTHTMQQTGKVIRRLTASGIGKLVKRACGGRTRLWRFELASAAAQEGYMVQQVDIYNEEKKCPATARCLANPTTTFWEAWRFNKGDRVFAQYGAVGYSDMTNRPPVRNKSGYAVAAGEIKFYSKATTGDLGDLNKAPASPNGGWGPGNAPLSHSLPSTKTKPPWWSTAPIEGPTNRIAYSAWRCCSSGSNFNVVRTTP